ncbi:hypothetical protein BC941DRAFT_453655 [Chlamydoabsidia padenii]|nr:hypothetical protein BC941DRAFT_453655 [Chlamydoabsidia padenii]
MLFGRNIIQRLVPTLTSCRTQVTPVTKRWASLSTTLHSQPSFPWTTSQGKVTDKVTEHLSTLRPFSAPPAPIVQRPIESPLVEEGMQLTSVLRKRRLKMNKHKHKKLRKRTRALRKRLGK